LALKAAEDQARLARLLLDQERRGTGGARDLARLVPGGEGALGVAGAPVEGLAALGPARGDLADAAVRALDAERDRLGELAVRTARARDEPPVRAVARDQRRPA